jgi:hypothetical protein
VTISSPAAVRSTRRERCVFASRMFTVAMDQVCCGPGTMSRPDYRARCASAVPHQPGAVIPGK